MVAAAGAAGGLKPPSAGGLIGAGIGAGAGIIGELIAAGDYEKAAKLRQQQLEETLGIPPAQAEQLANSQVAQLKANPKMAKVQEMALQRLIDSGNQGGMTVEDKQKLNEVTRGQQLENRREQEAIRMNQASRGVGGGGSEMAQRMIAQQSQAQGAADRGLNVAAEASRRAYENMARAGGMAGQMRSQEFGEQETAARAADENARYNAMARERAYDRNVQRSGMRADAYGGSASDYEKEGKRKRGIPGDILENAGRGGQIGSQMGGGF